jgi:hypothetical protein
MPLALSPLSGEEARHASSQLVMAKLPELSGEDGAAAAVIVMGDLNARKYHPIP